jgi:heme exporter protein C
VYNIFAFAALIPLLFILPRLTDSLHPGNGGNPGFNSYDLDDKMRRIFYPAVIGWTLLGVWLTSLHIRIKKIEQNEK